MHGVVRLTAAYRQIRKMFNVIFIRSVVHQPICQNRPIDQSTRGRFFGVCRPKLGKFQMPNCGPTNDTQT